MYLLTHSTHFIYSYMESDLWLGTTEIMRGDVIVQYLTSFRKCNETVVKINMIYTLKLIIYTKCLHNNIPLSAALKTLVTNIVVF